MTVIQGIVEHGDERGRTLGFPTANIQLFDNQTEDGVLAAVIRTDSGKPWLAAVSIGRRQTFYAQTGNKLLEAHLLDFNDDLYGQKLAVTLTANSTIVGSFRQDRTRTAPRFGRCPGRWLLHNDQLTRTLEGALSD